MAQLLILLVIAAVAAIILWPRSDFVIRTGRAGVQVRGRLPQSKAPDVLQFFERELTAAGPLTVSGSRSRNGRLRLRFRGQLTPGDRQRIRNFLQTTL